MFLEQIGTSSRCPVGVAVVIPLLPVRQMDEEGEAT